MEGNKADIHEVRRGKDMKGTMNHEGGGFQSTRTQKKRGEWVWLGRYGSCWGDMDVIGKIQVRWGRYQCKWEDAGVDRKIGVRLGTYGCGWEDMGVVGKIWMWSKIHAVSDTPRCSVKCVHSNLTVLWTKDSSS